jgi:hypothetical protein
MTVSQKQGHFTNFEGKRGIPINAAKKRGISLKCPSFIH